MFGVVKFFQQGKGYGFIEAGCGNDILLHRRNLADKRQSEILKAGSKVEFDLAHQEKGAYAQNVKVVNTFTWMELPDECSHRFAVRCNETGSVKVFFNRTEADEWCRKVSAVPMSAAPKEDAACSIDPVTGNKTCDA